MQVHAIRRHRTAVVGLRLRMSVAPAESGAAIEQPRALSKATRDLFPHPQASIMLIYPPLTREDMADQRMVLSLG